MKLSKLMLTLAVAASAFAACNKQETTPVGTNYKSVDISLENVLFTKSVDATEIANGSDVVINDFMVYFTDGSTIYIPKQANGTDNSKVYFSTKDKAGLPEAYSPELQFHFLPAAVNQVVVLGNLGDQKNYPTTVEGFKKALEVLNEQTATNLRLYGKSALVPKTPDHNVNNPKHATDVYKADITLTPRIARVEVVNFVRSANGKVFNKVTIDQVVFDNYYPSYSDLTDEYAQTGTVVACPLTQTDIYNHFATATGWMSDNLALEFTSAETETANLAYHFFPDKTATATEAAGVVTTTGAYPRLLVKATGYYTGDTNPTPLYLYTKAFRTAPATTTETPKLISGEDYFAPAAIFEVEFTFSDENFLQQEKCVEVSVTPKKWNVIAVNPVL